MDQTGSVAKLILNKGFGFIKVQPAEQAIPDLFFHASATTPRELFDTLVVGDSVTYEVSAETPDGRPRAINVRRAGG
jgi:cold shock CspA family protein